MYSRSIICDTFRVIANLLITATESVVRLCFTENHFDQYKVNYLNEILT